MSAEKTQLLNQIAGLEHQIKIGKAASPLAAAIARLRKNKDFIAVIEKEFMVDEVARFMEVATDPRMEVQFREDALQEAKAPAALKRWLLAREQMNDHFLANLEAMEEELSYARAELASFHEDPQNTDE